MNQDDLKDLLHYDKDTGVFTWLVSRGHAAVGKIAGCINAKGYLQIRIYGKTYRAHRLVFLYMEGKLPPDQVDHINRDKTDNRWSNLRHATHLINQNNKANNNAVIGVGFRKQNKKWFADATQVKGKRKRLGYSKYYLIACAMRWEWESLSW